MTYINEEGSKGIKILFTGLDNAGKSSIVLSLLREFTKIAIVKPTKGAERRSFEFLNLIVSEWDLGGQERYRNEYIKDPDLFFTKTESLIFVIDIQSPDRVIESISYLQTIVDQFNKFEIKPDINIFFHKIDPEIYIKAQNEIDNIIDNIKNQIKKKIEYPNFNFYKTTIFDLSTIINAMSEILLRKFPKTEILKETIEQFANKINAIGLEIIDDNSFILGSFYKDDFIKQLLNQTTPYFLKVNDTFESVSSEACKPDDQMVIQRFGKYFLFKKFILKKSGLYYYLLLCKDDFSFDQEIYDTFIKLLKELLYQ
ncbi:MAG TPA: ADP-ribosylation factor-like protein [Candidatus Lokiarchaeia archaeon]